MRQFIHIPEILGDNIPYPRRKIRHPEDLAVFVRLKKIDANFHSKNNSFGVYFGRLNKKYCVGVRNLNDDNITMMQAFNTIRELKHCWILD